MASNTSTPENKPSGFRRVLRILGRIVRYSLSAALVLYLFLALRPDAKPIDDSLLMQKLPPVPKEQNAYDELVRLTKQKEAERNRRYAETIFTKSACSSDNSSKICFPPTNRIPTQKDMAGLVKNCGGMTEETRKILASHKYIAVYSNSLRTKQQYADYYTMSFWIFRGYPRSESLFAWHDLNNGRYDQAIERISAAIHPLSTLSKPRGGWMLLVARRTTTNIFNEISAMLDSGLMPQDRYGKLSRISGQYRIEDFAIPCEQAKADYQKAHKDIFRQPCNNWTNPGCAIWRIKRRALIKPQAYLNGAYKEFSRFCEKDIYSAKYDPDFFPGSNLVGWNGWHSKRQEIENEIGAFFSGNYEYESSREFSNFLFQSQYAETFGTDAMQKLLQIKFAVLQFKEKENRLPKNLDELAPKYLSTIPEDPFDHKPLRYNNEKAVVYSVGMNMKDDGGTGTYSPAPLAFDKPSPDIVLNLLPPKSKIKK